MLDTKACNIQYQLICFDASTSPSRQLQYVPCRHISPPAHIGPHYINVNAFEGPPSTYYLHRTDDEAGCVCSSINHGSLLVPCYMRHFTFAPYFVFPPWSSTHGPPRFSCSCTCLPLLDALADVHIAHPRVSGRVESRSGRKYPICNMHGPHVTGHFCCT